jgi:gluconolactonase
MRTLLTERRRSRWTTLLALPAIFAAFSMTGALVAQAPDTKPFMPTGQDFVPAGPADATIDLGTADGVKLVEGQWRYSDTKIIEVDFKRADKTPDKTYDYEPHAGVVPFDDSKWEVIDPATIKRPRSTGKLCFNWYRINLTIPAKIGDFATAGSTVSFETTIDDYCEIWVDGKMPHTLGQTGGTVIKGFNALNRLVIGENVQPGQHIQLAVFGINGPLSVAPANYVFMRTSPRLNFYKAPAGALK